MDPALEHVESQDELRDAVAFLETLNGSITENISTGTVPDLGAGTINQDGTGHEDTWLIDDILWDLTSSGDEMETEQCDEIDINLSRRISSAEASVSQVLSLVSSVQVANLSTSIAVCAASKPTCNKNDIITRAFNAAVASEPSPLHYDDAGMTASLSSILEESPLLKDSSMVEYRHESLDAADAQPCRLSEQPLISTGHSAERVLSRQTSLDHGSTELSLINAFNAAIASESNPLHRDDSGMAASQLSILEESLLLKDGNMLEYLHESLDATDAQPCRLSEQPLISSVPSAERVLSRQTSLDHGSTELSSMNGGPLVDQAVARQEFSSHNRRHVIIFISVVVKKKFTDNVDENRL